jgi:hypothetical protein
MLLLYLPFGVYLPLSTGIPYQDNYIAYSQVNNYIVYALAVVGVGLLVAVKIKQHKMELWTQAFRPSLFDIDSRSRFIAVMQWVNGFLLFAALLAAIILSNISTLRSNGGGWGMALVILGLLVLPVLFVQTSTLKSRPKWLLALVLLFGVVPLIVRVSSSPSIIPIDLASYLCPFVAFICILLWSILNKDYKHRTYLYVVLFSYI